MSLNNQFYTQNDVNERLGSGSKRPPIPLPRKKSYPDVIKDTSLHVVPLSSDDDSSLSHHSHNIETDVSDVDTSPKRLHRSGTFTKLDIHVHQNIGLISKPKEVRNNENEQTQESVTQPKEIIKRKKSQDTVRASSSTKDDQFITPVIAVDQYSKAEPIITETVATVKKNTINGSTKLEAIEKDEKQENIEPSSYECKINAIIESPAMNNLTVMGGEKNLEPPPSDSTDFSEDLRSLSVHRKKKKKKLTKKSKPLSEETELIEIKPEPSTSKYEDDQVVCICVHESDLLLTDGVLKPLVEVHVVNQSTGQYLSKQLPPSATGEDGHRLSPVQTQVFNFHANRCITPKWEEQLILLESPSLLFTPDTVLLFEILDRSGHPKPSTLYNKLGATSSVGRVAWAFLKPIGANGVENLNKKIRLQLFRPRTEIRAADNTSPVTYRWFKKFEKCTKLRNSLYVTVRAVQRPSPLSPMSKSRVEVQEVTSLGSKQSITMATGQEVTSLRSKESVTMTTRQQTERQWQWTKLPGESCKIPNNKFLSLSGGPDGTLAGKFSPNGFLLAVAQHSLVSVFSIPDGELLHLFNAHSGLIYSLSWHEDSSRFLTCSADRTVCVWRLCRAEPVWLLPHPCYVYDALFLDSHVITCGYDGVLRVWKCAEGSVCAELSQELTGHAGYVTALCYNAASAILFSGDSQGVVLTWRGHTQGDTRWQQEKTLLISGLHGVVINKLMVYGRACLIVHSQDSVLRMVDASSGAVLQWYKGCVNDSINTGCTLSPCRSLLLAASEDGSVYSWDCHSGLLRGVYLALGRPGPMALHYHPADHMLLVGSYAAQASPPVLVLSFARDETGKSVGLHLLSQTKEKETKASLPPLKDRAEKKENVLASAPAPDKLSNIMIAMDQVLKSMS